MKVISITWIRFCPHYLASSIVEANRQAGTVGFNVAHPAVVPFHCGQTDGSGDIHQAMQFNFSLQQSKQYNASTWK